MSQQRLQREIKVLGRLMLRVKVILKYAEKNENVANTNITVNINVAQNSDIKTKCIVGEMLRVHSYLKYKDDL